MVVKPARKRILLATSPHPKALKIGLKIIRPDGSNQIEPITVKHHTFVTQANTEYQLLNLATGEFIAHYTGGPSLYAYAKRKQLLELIRHDKKNSL